MSEKVTINLDVTKLPRERIKARSFTTRSGEEVTAKEIRLEVVPLKDPKLIKSYDNADLMKTHFVCLSQTKQERDDRVDTVYVGEGTQFVQRGQQSAPSNDPPKGAFYDFDDDLPF